MFFHWIQQAFDMKTGVQVVPEFTVVQHERDVQLLFALKEFFGCGVVRTNHGDRMAFRVRGQEHLLQRVVPFFVEHPLKSKKRVDFEKFRTVLLRWSGRTPDGKWCGRDPPDRQSDESRASKVKSSLSGNIRDN